MKQTQGFYWQPKSGATAAPDAIQRELDLIVSTGANTIYVPYRALDDNLIGQVRARQLRLLVDWTVFAGEDLRQAYPDSVPIDDQGTPFERDGWYFPACPNHPQIRAQHLQNMDVLLSAHGREIGGLWLDFIRFPVRWERAEPTLRRLCFCANCLRSFLQIDQAHFSPEETRAHAAEILRDRYEEWVDWKCRCIADFVQEVRQRIDAHQGGDEGIQLGMFSLPWRRADYDSALRAVAGQDLGRLAASVDCFSPMVYHGLCRQSPAWVAAVTEDVAAWTQKPVLPIVQSVDAPDVMTPDMLHEALIHALRAPGIGVTIFTFAPLLESEGKARVVTEVFRGM